MPDLELNGDLSEMLRQVIANPEIAGLISSLGKGQNAEGTPAAAPIAEPAAAPHAEEASASVLQDDSPEIIPKDTPAQTVAPAAAAVSAIPAISPEMLSKLPAMMSALSSMGLGGGGGHSSTQSDHKDEKKGGEDAKRKALLKALKPYMNPKRQAMINSMLQIGDLTKLFGNGLGI